MLFKLKKNSPGVYHYKPPIEIPRLPVGADPKCGIDRTMPEDEQIKCLLWVPALLVCRFLFQFPVLHSERDELFSIGLMELVSTVKDNPEIPGNKIGAYVNINACAAMEAYCNNLGSAITIHTRTRYRCKEQGKETPESVKITAEAEVRDDDFTELVIADACAMLGIDLETATSQERNELARTLGLEV